MTSFFFFFLILESHSPTTHWVDSFEQLTDPSEIAPVKGETKNISHVNSREN